MSIKKDAAGRCAYRAGTRTLIGYPPDFLFPSDLLLVRSTSFLYVICPMGSKKKPTDSSNSESSSSDSDPEAETVYYVGQSSVKCDIASHGNVYVII